MNSITKFFLFCAGVNHSILKRSPVDTGKIASIGATVLLTGIFAAIAGGYAMYLTFDNVWWAMMTGLLWGVTIFNLDRYIVSTANKAGGLWGNVAIFLPRLALALCIALVVAKPLELKIFEPEINNELVMMRMEGKQMKEAKILERYDSLINPLNENKSQLLQRLNEQAERRDILVQAAVAEADGTGGSLQKNLGPIYKTKKEAADLASNEYIELKQTIDPQLMTIEESITALQAQKETEISTILDGNAGIADRMEALSRLSSSSRAISLAVLFITLLFIIIETAPIFTKLLSAVSPYDMKMAQHHHLYQMQYDQQIQIAGSLNVNKIKTAVETDKVKTTLAIQAENELSKHIIAKELQRKKESELSWKDIVRPNQVFG